MVPNLRKISTGRYLKPDYVPVSVFYRVICSLHGNFELTQTFLCTGVCYRFPQSLYHCLGLFFLSSFSKPVMVLAIGVLAGGMLQFFFQVPFLIKKKTSFRFNLNFRHPAIKRIGFLMIPD